VEVDPQSVSDIGTAMESVLALNDQARNERGRALVAHAQTATREKFLAEWKNLISAELS
jgi:hypothetical protein